MRGNDLATVANICDMRCISVKATLLMQRKHNLSNERDLCKTQELRGNLKLTVLIINKLGFAILVAAIVLQRSLKDNTSVFIIACLLIFLSASQ